MDLVGPDGFSDFIDQVKLTVRMDETKILLADLRVFAPSLPEFDDEIFLSGAVTGTVSDIKSEEFLIRLGEKNSHFWSF